MSRCHSVPCARTKARILRKTRGFLGTFAGIRRATVAIHASGAFVGASFDLARSPVLEQHGLPERQIMKLRPLSTVVVLALSTMLGLGCSSTEEPPSPKAKPLMPSELPAPPKGEGFQFKTEAFPVPAGVEEQDCYFYKVRDLAVAGGLPADEPVNLHRVRMVQRDGSHHMNLFRVKSIVGLDPAKGSPQRARNGEGECFKSPNWADWPLVANTQQDGDVDWTFPDGVANVFQPDEWIMLQTHYVNATSQSSPDGFGEVAINFHTIPKSAVKAELGTVFATKQSIRVCSSNKTPTFEGSCQINLSLIHISEPTRPY